MQDLSENKDKACPVSKVQPVKASHMEEKENRPAPAFNPFDPERQLPAIQPAPHNATPANVRPPATLAQVQKRPPVHVPTTAPAPVLDPLISLDNLAERLYKAMDGPGTDEEQVYLALQQVRGNASAIQQLKVAYQRKYNVELEEDLRDDLEDEELAYAQTLLMSGQGSSGRLAPGGSPHVAAAMRIHHILSEKGFAPEELYAVLDPYNRDLIAVHELVAAYRKLTSRDLREELRERLHSGSHLDLVMHMMGGAAMRANVEQKVLDEAQAQLLMDDLARLKFVTDTDTLAPVPFHYPKDGCHLRAHLMAQRMTELGYASEKQFAISSEQDQLNLMTPYAGESAEHVPQDKITWWFHVAPVIRVRAANGAIESRVLDPALADKPLRPSEWTALQSKQPFVVKDEDEILNVLAGKVESHPAKPREAAEGQLPRENYLFQADRDAITPGNLRVLLSPEQAQAEMDRNRAGLSQYAIAAGAHELAKAITEELKQPIPQASRLIALLRARPYVQRKAFVDGIPDQSGLAMPLPKEVVVMYGYKNWMQQLQGKFNAMEIKAIASAVYQR